MLVELEDGSTRKIRTADFKPYFPHADPKATTAATFDFRPGEAYTPEQYHQAN